MAFISHWIDHVRLVCVLSGIDSAVTLGLCSNIEGAGKYYRMFGGCEVLHLSV